VKEYFNNNLFKNQTTDVPSMVHPLFFWSREWQSLLHS